MRTKIKELKFQKRAVVAWLLMGLLVLFAMALAGVQTITSYDVATGTAAAGLLLFIIDYLYDKEKAKVQP